MIVIGDELIGDQVIKYSDKYLMDDRANSLTITIAIAITTTTATNVTISISILNKF